MARPKKEACPFAMRMDKEVYGRLCAYCEATGVPKTAAVERALKMFIDAYEEQQEILKASTL